MIDVFDVTNFKRTKSELEEYFIFAVCVAGKTASIIAKKVHSFIYESKFYENGDSPFDVVKKMIKDDCLDQELHRVRMGKYEILNRCFTQLIQNDFDMYKVSPEELEKLPGVGYKTSRYFIMHSRDKQELAAIDTHILKFLKSKGHEVPKTTPGSSKKYKELETLFLKYAKESGMSLADFDLHIWSTSTTRSQRNEKSI